ncbi:MULTISPECIES: flagellar biosynthetic protein FliO [Paenibacillus]|uniref:flagellar biosynthetic protein FliO n=1 Tax=Paenibacillus TaxID=44249 RepID=UPI000CF89160|nr:MULTISPECIES: flagellar biosynthetic protein FliO [Paenibacillus]MBJ9990224.1 flagellar biosynthetic protein FliO [Paenibacillus sp. S28]MEC0173276.1 flagellar biosynthetic protein FliO [Paenibacillus favisporus]PQP89600.1 flagellar protein [Paenibacillus sp. AR247]
MSNPDTPLPGSGNYALSLVYVIIVLAVIIALIILLIRFLGRKNKTWFSSRSIRTLGAVGLGPNKSLQVIEIGSSVYLVGVGEDIRLVDKITDPDEVAVILASFEQDPAYSQNGLTPLVAKLAAKLRKTGPVSEEISLEETPEFHEVFDEKLRRMSNRKEKMEELLREDNTTDRLREP